MPVDVNKLVTIDNDLRTINIPSGISILGVQYDDDVHKICFEMPRYVSDTDLSEFSIRVNYKNPNGDGDIFEVEDKVVNDDTITFSWVVGPTAFLCVGDVLFSICLKKYADDGIVDKEYNTTIAKLPVLEGLETGPLVVRENSDVLERWKLELFDIVKDAGKTAYEYAVEGGYEGSEEEFAHSINNAMGVADWAARKENTEIFNKNDIVLGSGGSYTTINGTTYLKYKCDAGDTQPFTWYNPFSSMKGALAVSLKAISEDGDSSKTAMLSVEYSNFFSSAFSIRLDGTYQTFITSNDFNALYIRPTTNSNLTVLIDVSSISIIATYDLSSYYANKVFSNGVYPINKTDNMIYNVGVDTEGKLWSEADWRIIDTKNIGGWYRSPVSISNGIVTFNGTTDPWYSQALPETGSIDIFVCNKSLTTNNSQGTLKHKLTAIDYSAGTFQLLDSSGTEVTTSYDTATYWIMIPDRTSQSISFRVPADNLGRTNKRLKLRYFTPYTYCTTGKKHFRCNDARFEFTERSTVKHSGGYEMTIEVEYSENHTYLTYNYYRHIKLINGTGTLKEYSNIVRSTSNPETITFTADDDIFVPGAKLQLWVSNHY